MGIPYAKATRFQYPNPHVPAWGKNVRNAHTPGPQCPQECRDNEPRLYCQQNTQSSEDCLSLNVWKPEARGGENVFPVIVYIHGGDFSTGSGAAPVYDAHFLSLEGRVVVVTVNYRLGAFGYLSIFDDYGDAVGNFGFRDQQMALRWVKNNIANFKGDPNRITLMGNGAGCLSVVSHMASHSSNELFRSVILEGCPLAMPYRTEAEARLQSQAFADHIGCKINDLSCYRHKSKNDVLQAQLSVQPHSFSNNSLTQMYPWGPTIDDEMISSHPLDVFKDLSRFKMKPAIIGLTQNEGRYFKNKYFPGSVSLDSYRRFVKNTSGQNANTQQLSASSDLSDELADFITDFVFQCPSKFAADQMLKKQTSGRNLQPLHYPRAQLAHRGGVWVYKYIYPITNLTLGLHSLASSSCSGHSCHGQDVRNLFFSAALPTRERIDSEELARQMVMYWSNFAKTQTVAGRMSSLYAMQLEKRAMHAMWKSARQRITLPKAGNKSRSRQSQRSPPFWPSYRGVKSPSIMLLKANPTPALWSAIKCRY